MATDEGFLTQRLLFSLEEEADVEARVTGADAELWLSLVLVQ